MPNRRSLMATVAAVALVAIAAGSAIGVRVGDDSGATPAPAADRSAAPDAPTASVADSAEDRSGTKQDGTEQGGTEQGGPEQGPAGQDPSEAGGAEAAPTAPSAPPADQEPSTAHGVTVVPEAPGPADDYDLDPDRPSASPTPPAYDPPSTTAFARGRIVAGYPARLLPAAPRSAVLSSSVAPSPERVQVALVGRRSSDSESVLAFYRDVMSGSGFREASARAVGGGQAVAFRRGADRVVVTIDPGTARTYSVYATLVVSEG